MDIGKFRSLGEIAKAFLFSLDIKVEKVDPKFDRLCKEKEADLTNLKLKIFKHLDSLKFYDKKIDKFEKEVKSSILKEIDFKSINADDRRKTKGLLKEFYEEFLPAFRQNSLAGYKVRLVKVDEDDDLKLDERILNIIGDNFMYIYNLNTFLINDYMAVNPQEKIDFVVTEYLFIPLLKNIFREIEQLDNIELLFDYNKAYGKDKENNYYNQILNNIKEKSQLNSFNFLKKTNYKGTTDNKCYLLTRSLNKHHRSNRTLNELVDELFKNENIKNSSLEKESVLLNFILSRMYLSFLDEINQSKEWIDTHVNTYDPQEIWDNLAEAIRLPMDIEEGEIEKLDELKALVVKTDKIKTQEDIFKFESLYERVKDKYHNFPWYIEHCYARHLIMKNELKDALSVYLSILENNGRNCGRFLESIIKESLSLAAYLKDKRKFDKIYDKANVYGVKTMFPGEGKKFLFEVFYHQQFGSYFPKSSFYDYKTK